MIQTTATALRPGMMLHRVEQKPGSRVFEAPVDSRVLAVGPNPEYPDFIEVVLEPTYPSTRSSLNLAPERGVTIEGEVAR